MDNLPVLTSKNIFNLGKFKNGFTVQDDSSTIVCITRIFPVINFKEEIQKLVEEFDDQIENSSNPNLTSIKIFAKKMFGNLEDKYFILGIGSVTNRIFNFVFAVRNSDISRLISEEDLCKVIYDCFPKWLSEGFIAENNCSNAYDIITQMTPLFVKRIFIFSIIPKMKCGLGKFRVEDLDIFFSCYNVEDACSVFECDVLITNEEYKEAVKEYNKIF